MSGSITELRAPGPRPELAWFGQMIPHCLEQARAAQAQGKPIVGILCEFTPRELILAAGGVPVCLCGGDARTIPAAEEHLPNNLCPLIKSTYGYSVLRRNPFLEMASLLVAETTCDGKKKMYELLGERYPMHVLELPQKPHSRTGLAQWETALRRLQAELERRFEVTITDEAVRAAIGVMNRERRLRRELAALMKRDYPPLTGRELLELKSSISGQPEYLEQLETVLAALKAEERAGVRRRRVRVLMTGVPMVHGAEWVLELVEKHGGLVVAQENCTGLKPILEDVDKDAPDPMHALALKYYHLPCSVMTPNNDRMELLPRLAAEYRAECIIELVWQACITYDVESYRVKRLAEELELPYLRITTDYSVSDSARIAVRVEALFESVHHGSADFQAREPSHREDAP
ncbi:MAG: 2-hydroxyacyl-CoA dehydratase [Candidatus Hydrogenedentes bacterium]|nr:2-hydroxyacyl-CoA dehydratase [Candidatus Hydrogenedentota bacterium]